MAKKDQSLVAGSGGGTSSTVRTLHDFRAKLNGGGARPNLFEVSMDTFPPALQSGSGDDKSSGIWDNLGEKFRFMCKAAQMPASTIAEIPVPFRGRILKVAGDRTFEPWTVTIINSENYDLRHAFEMWMHAVSDLTTNTGVTNPASYMTNASIRHFGRGNQLASVSNSDSNKTNTVTRAYTVEGIWPSEVSAIDVSYDSTDTIEEFTVTFQMMHWVVGAEAEDAPKDGDDKGNNSQNADNKGK